MLGTARTDVLSAPAAAAASLWLDAWLVGQVGADDLIGVLTRVAPDTPEVLRDGGSAHLVSELLRRVRAEGAAHAWPVLPRPGRIVGWPTEVRVEPQSAVLIVTPPRPEGSALPVARGLLHVGAGGWVLEAVAEQDSPRSVAAMLAEAIPPRTATRRFTELVGRATDDLFRLGLERAPRGTGVSRWARTLGAVPPGTTPGLAHLLGRLCTVLDAVELALTDDGAAITAEEAHARGARLRALHDQLTDLVTAATVGAAAGSPSLPL